MPYLGAILFCNRLLPCKYGFVILTECDRQIMSLLLKCYVVTTLAVAEFVCKNGTSASLSG
jgi:hypothetical protein